MSLYSALTSAAGCTYGYVQTLQYVLLIVDKAVFAALIFKPTGVLGSQVTNVKRSNLPLSCLLTFFNCRNDHDAELACINDI